MVKRILCIGAGYVGGPTMAVIARHCPDVQVVVADINAERVAAWQSGHPPIYEPGLQEVVRASLGRNLHFTAEVDRAIAEAEMIFVSVNTPTKAFGLGAGRAADLQYWEKTARSILRNAQKAGHRGREEHASRPHRRGHGTDLQGRPARATLRGTVQP